MSMCVGDVAAAREPSALFLVYGKFSQRKLGVSENEVALSSERSVGDANYGEESCAMEGSGEAGSNRAPRSRDMGGARFAVTAVGTNLSSPRKRLHETEAVGEHHRCDEIRV